MRKVITTLVAGLVTVGLLAMATNSYAGASAKFTATLSATAVLPKDSTEPSTLLNAALKTPNKKDLLIGVSLVTGLYTQTKVASKDGIGDTSSATAGIEVVVEIDGVKVFPGKVIFDQRIQTLSAQLGGYFTACADTGTWTAVAVPDPTNPNGYTYQCTETLFDTDNDPTTPSVSVPDGIITLPCECEVAPEIIELILETTGAHHFNFVARNVEPGLHTITVKVAKNLPAPSSQNGSASAWALVDKGSLTVEEVRATNSPDGVNYLGEMEP